MKKQSNNPFSQALDLLRENGFSGTELAVMLGGCVLIGIAGVFISRWLM